MTDGNRPTTSGIDRLKQTVDDQLTSRRRFMAGTAALGGAGLAAASPVGGRSEHGGGNGSDDGTNDENGSGDDGPSDVDILNFALKLEYLEARFYEEGLDNIGEQQLSDSLCQQNVRGSTRERAFGDLRAIQEHEEAHVEVIDQTVQDLGGEPIEEPEFDFGSATENVGEFLATAATLETTGVGAYAGAAPMIDNAELIPPALSIHSVEARHTSFLNVLNGDSGFPNAFDEALTIEEVNERAGPFIVEE
jgi:rubrerythrin